jgi:hypothetical protein
MPLKANEVIFSNIKDRPCLAKAFMNEMIKLFENRESFSRYVGGWQTEIIIKLSNLSFTTIQNRWQLITFRLGKKSQNILLHSS